MSSRTRKMTAVAVAENEGPSPKVAKPKGSRYRLCSVPDCTKQVQQGGVCCRHGAKTTRASCSHEGCTNVAKRGGLCRKHGAFKLETCTREGCKRVAKQGKFCDSHDTEGSKATIGSSKRVRERKICSHEGCSNKAERGGVCSRHDMESSDVFHNGCTDQAAEGGACMEHGELNFLCDYSDYYEEMYEQLPV
mmetsp:Transcript_36232/g.66560  ORF Transcript_36232/g.66560 Transcript_36232/m.66560 type:complete len:192 (+) Transcript_36232:188-763(+)|eukprot:CAMPEP_0201873834 /NCGR_PEP_ID=MMETSP0902-20130614/6231_1 /ASSEMBLY_ACC=CAM_ASM_000551 /TAXON_ID=420261 /ORGANISM="Thalassiosira antarctica, Strain CCMP982" /LENGTH=191 /DNA_ID=CAMNT_0048400525 /DNA_START=175 /DNA_END=750 /DNA_ORIENTATION=-